MWRKNTQYQWAWEAWVLQDCPLGHSLAEFRCLGPKLGPMGGGFGFPFQSWCSCSGVCLFIGTKPDSGLRLSEGAWKTNQQKSNFKGLQLSNCMLASKRSGQTVLRHMSENAQWELKRRLLAIIPILWPADQKQSSQRRRESHVSWRMRPLQ